MFVVSEVDDDEEIKLRGPTGQGLRRPFGSRNIIA
jgi:hypothetical protein